MGTARPRRAGWTSERAWLSILAERQQNLRHSCLLGYNLLLTYSFTYGSADSRPTRCQATATAQVLLEASA
jgi:hypothetical protein